MKKSNHYYYKAFIKTINTIKKIWLKILITIIIATIIKFYIPVQKFLENSYGILIAVLIGSLSIGNPTNGYIIASSLKSKPIIISFLLSWVLVGFDKMPIELEYFSKKYIIIRNVIGIIISLLGGILAYFILK